jgi:hypothetical protein
MKHGVNPLLQPDEQMLRRAQYAQQEALDAYRRAAESNETETQKEWLRAAAMWEALADQYQLTALAPIQ